MDEDKNVLYNLVSVKIKRKKIRYHYNITYPFTYLSKKTKLHMSNYTHNFMTFFRVIYATNSMSCYC